MEMMFYAGQRPGFLVNFGIYYHVYQDTVKYFFTGVETLQHVGGK